MTQPVVYMIAGPNGAGKTTLAMKLLPEFLSVYEFVNADEIARGLNPLNRDDQAMAAGRLMLGRIDDLIQQQKSFSFESTGSEKKFFDKLQQAKKVNYIVRLIYLWLPTPEFAKERVKLRVSQGGHSIPEDTVERRYERSLSNLIPLYLPIADHAVVFDSTFPFTGKPDIIAEKFENNVRKFKPNIWSMIESSAKEVDRDC
jgi:predicted ABC-type ATPase